MYLELKLWDGRKTDPALLSLSHVCSQLSFVRGSSHLHDSLCRYEAQWQSSECAFRASLVDGPVQFSFPESNNRHVLLPFSWCLSDGFLQLRWLTTLHEVVLVLHVSVLLEGAFCCVSYQGILDVFQLKWSDVPSHVTNPHLQPPSTHSTRFIITASPKDGVSPCKCVSSCVPIQSPLVICRRSPIFVYLPIFLRNNGNDWPAAHSCAAKHQHQPPENPSLDLNR